MPSWLNILFVYLYSWMKSNFISSFQILMNVLLLLITAMLMQHVPTQMGVLLASVMLATVVMELSAMVNIHYYTPDWIYDINNVEEAWLCYFQSLIEDMEYYYEAFFNTDRARFLETALHVLRSVTLSKCRVMPKYARVQNSRTSARSSNTGVGLTMFTEVTSLFFQQNQRCFFFFFLNF